MSFECLDCKAIQSNGGGYCEDCAVHNDEIREVAREIREWADQYDDDISALSDTEKTTVASYERAADEIEKLAE